MMRAATRRSEHHAAPAPGGGHVDRSVFSSWTSALAVLAPMLLQGCHGDAATGDSAVEHIDDAAATTRDADGDQPPDAEAELDAEALDAASASREDASERDAASADASLPATSDAGLDAADLDAANTADAGARQDAGDASSAANPDGGALANAVDLLFLIDNSGSMSEEQKKLTRILPDFVRVLATGRRNPASTVGQPDFPPVTSLHIGVVSSDMGVNGAPAQKSCGQLSFVPTERDTRVTNQFLNKPLGDDGLMQTSVAVAVSGIFVLPMSGDPAVEIVPGDAQCQGLGSPPGTGPFFGMAERFIDYRASAQNLDAAATTFSCIARLGKNGCGLEQQLESLLKALTPPDSAIKFSMGSSGHGTAREAGVSPGANAGFLREDALLVLVLVSDEDDCSIPDASNEIFDAMSTRIPGEINVRCGLPENQSLLHQVPRYVQGLRALKSAAHQDRIIVTSIVGMPLATDPNQRARVGEAAIDAVLASDAMQFRVQRNQPQTADEPVPACTSIRGDGVAAPARRLLQVTKSFGDNAIVSSICEDEYASALNTLLEKVAAQLRRP
jgi:hypothetical protein